MDAWQQVIIEPVTNMLNTVAIYLPFLFGGLLILLVGWLIAGMISTLVQRGLDRLKFNAFTGKIGLNELLSRGGIGMSASSLLATFVYWVLMIVVLATTLQAVGLEEIVKLLDRVTNYVPNVIAAMFVVVIGMFLANVVSGTVRATAKNVNVLRADFLASLVKIAILIFTAVSALEQLNIVTFFVTTTFQIFFAAVCFAIALAVGLGGKDLAARILWDFYNQQNERK